MKNSFESLSDPFGDFITDGVFELWAEFLTMPNNSLSPPYRPDLLKSDALDFSVDSLHHVDDYLGFVRKTIPRDDDLATVCMQCGSYVGEVIRRASPPGSCRWVSFAAAMPHGPGAEPDPVGPHNFARLLCGKASSYPFGKVLKRLKDGEEHNVWAFATMVIQLNNLPEGRFEAFLRNLKSGSPK